MTTIGELRHLIAIQRKTRGANDGAQGYATETWATFATVSAKIDPKTGREIIAADQVVHRLSAVVTIRRRRDVTAANRVLYKGREMAIFGVRDVFAGGWHWTELQCEEGAPL